MHTRSSKGKLLSFLLHPSFTFGCMTAIFPFYLLFLVYLFFSSPHQSFYRVICNVKSIFKKLYHMPFFKVIQTWPKKNSMLNLCMFPETETNYFFSVPFMRHLSKWRTGAACLEHPVLRIFS